MHLGVGTGLLKAVRRARQIGATGLQFFSDNPTAWRRRAEPPPEVSRFVEYAAAAGIGSLAIHASYLINLAGAAEPFASQSRAGLIHELQRAPSYGVRYVNTHIGSHRGEGHAAGIARVGASVDAVLAETPPGVILVLENSAGGGDTLGSSIEELAEIMDALSHGRARVAFCLDTAHLWGAGHDIGTAEGAAAVIDRFDELIGIDRLPLIHLNDSRSALGSRTDRHEHLGAGRIGPVGLGALLRDQRLARTTFIMETPGEEAGYDAVNLRRAWLLYGGATTLPELPPKAFKLPPRTARSRKRADPATPPG